jgi:hypothetical protein
MPDLDLSDIEQDEDLLDEPGGGEDDDAEEEEEEAKPAKGSGSVGDLLDDIFAEESEEDDKLKAFGDLEHLTMVEVSSEIEAVLEELKLRQGGYE